jgi:hypothetical protein
VEAGEILEVWEAKTYISRSFPKTNSPSLEPTAIGEGKEITLEKLAGIVLNLQKEVINLQSAKIKNTQ